MNGNPNKKESSMKFSIISPEYPLVRDDPPGHYLDLLTNIAQIITVGDFPGIEAYANVLPGFVPISAYPIYSDPIEANAPKRTAVDLWRPGAFEVGQTLSGGGFDGRKGIPVWVNRGKPSHDRSH